MRFSTILYSILLALVGFSSCKKDTTTQGPFVMSNDTLLESKQVTLIEATVSQNCGACPLGHHKIKELENSIEDLTHISHYLFGPLHHPYSTHIMEKINKTAYTPIGNVDRRHEDGSVVYYPIDHLKGVIALEQQEQIPVEVAIDTGDVIQEQLDIVVEVRMLDADYRKPLRLTVMLVERSVIGDGTGYDQRNYGHDDPDHPYYDQGEWIEGFEHTMIIRELLTDFDGDQIDLSVEDATWNGSILTADLEQPVSDYRIVAFVTEEGDEVKPILSTSVLDIEA